MGFAPTRVRIPPPAPTFWVQVFLAFKFPGGSPIGLKTLIYDYEERLQSYRRVMAGFSENGETAHRFPDHLFSLDLSVVRVSKIDSHIPAVLRLIDFSLKDATRSDVERVVAAINCNKN